MAPRGELVILRPAWSFGSPDDDVKQFDKDDLCFQTSLRELSCWGGQLVVIILQ